MEPVKVAMQIERLITALTAEGHKLQEFVKSQELPTTERDYQIQKEKACADMKSKGMTIGEIDKQIKGRCSDQLFARDVAVIKFKAMQARIGILKAQLNGFQSINKNLSEL